jgi:NAD(P)-dependent dehydrogenase (short-subunit alcohol dehydrogenase family)
LQARIDWFGRLDTLVSNAAFQLHARTLEDLTPAHFERTVKTNLHGMYDLTRAAYSMTKGAIHAWTRSLAAQPEEISPAYVFLASPPDRQLHHGRDPAHHRGIRLSRMRVSRCSQSR